MTLTPFEKRSTQAVLSRLGEATVELVTKSEECMLMLEDWRACKDPEEREMLRGVAREALKERRECNQQLQLIAKLLEEHFGISA